MKLGLPAGIVCVVLMASCLSLVTTARADDETARLHFQAGAKEFEAGRYEAALASFSAAYELSGRPELLYNIALCHEELGRYGEAADHLRRYLDEVENGARAPHRDPTKGGGRSGAAGIASGAPSPRRARRAE